jgi:predicted DNA-binding transcriptional regulator YafY
LRKDTLTNLIKIIKCLEQAREWLWIREISRRCGIHHKTVGRLIDRHLTMFLDIQTMEPFNIRMVRLKPGVNVDKVLRFLAVKDRIENRE